MKTSIVLAIFSSILLLVFAAFVYVKWHHGVDRPLVVSVAPEISEKIRSSQDLEQLRSIASVLSKYQTTQGAQVDELVSLLVLLVVLSSVFGAGSVALC